MHKLLMPLVGYLLALCVITGAMALPASKGSLEWHEPLGVFKGHLTLEAASTPSPWVLYANVVRAQGPLPSGLGLQEQVSPFSPKQWRKSSSLQLIDVRTGTRTCSYSLGPQGAWLDISEDCPNSHWVYEVQVPQRSGTWAQTGPHTFVFGAPLGPTPYTTRLQTDWSLKGAFVECQSCPSPSTVAGITPLPPLYISTQKPWPSRNVEFFGRLQVAHRGLENEAAQTLWEALRALTSQMPYLEKSKPITLWVTGDTLATTLVQRQPGDIQLGRTFWLTPPYLRQYHLGAALRALIGETLLLGVRAHREPTSMAAYTRLHTLTNWLADRYVRKHFNALNSLKNLSQKLSFLPLFDGIFKGSVLSHNAIMLGGEEGPSALDRAVIADLYPTLSAKEVEDRLGWCSPGVAAHWERALQSPQSLWSWAEDLTNLPSQRCAPGWSQSLVQKPPQEFINTVVEEDKVVATRDWVPPPPWRKWAPQTQTTTDTLLVHFKDSQQSTQELWSVPNSRLEYPTNPQDPAIQLLVEGPTTGTDPERHRIPRGVEVKIVDAKLGVSSGTHTLSVQGGVRWRILGDDFERAMALKTEYTKGSFFISPLVSFTIPVFKSFAPRFVLGNRSEVKSPLTNTVLGQLSLQSAHLEGDPLVPRGGYMAFIAQHRIRNVLSTDLTTTLLKTSWAFPIGELGTWTPTVLWGVSTAPQALGGTESLPGAHGDELSTRHHGGYQQRVSWVLAHGGNTSLGGWAILRSLLLATQYNYVTDMDSGPTKIFNAPSAHTLQWKATLFFDFLGTKDQSLSAEISHTFNKSQPNIFTLSVGNIP